MTTKQLLDSCLQKVLEHLEYWSSQKPLEIKSLLRVFPSDQTPPPDQYFRGSYEGSQDLKEITCSYPIRFGAGREFEISLTVRLMNTKPLSTVSNIINSLYPLGVPGLSSHLAAYLREQLPGCTVTTKGSNYFEVSPLVPPALNITWTGRRYQSYLRIIPHSSSELQKLVAKTKKELGEK